MYRYTNKDKQARITASYECLCPGTRCRYPLVVMFRYELGGHGLHVCTDEDAKVFCKAKDIMKIIVPVTYPCILIYVLDTITGIWTMRS